MKKYNQKIFCALKLCVDKDTIVKRIKGRQTCLNCGLIFNKYFNPATSKNHSCDVKFLEKRSDDNKEIIVPTYKGQQGNPVLFSKSIKEKIMTIQGDVGAKGILELNEDKVLNVEIND